MGQRKKIYLASPLGFAETTRPLLRDIAYHLEQVGLDVYEPFSENVQFDAYINPHKVMQADLDGIDECDGVFAVLNGEPPDVGVAVEVGYAAARGKKIFLFRDDFRRCTDSQDFPVNLMFLAGQPHDWTKNFIKKFEDIKGNKELRAWSSS